MSTQNIICTNNNTNTNIYIAKMKPASILSAIYVIGTNTMVSARPNDANTDAAKTCGDLGVITSKDLAGTAPQNSRLCREHPNSLVNGGMGPNAAQKCWYGAPYGCSKGYCFRTCSSPVKGSWCWITREGGGAEEWKTCSRDEDCKSGGVCSPKVSGCKSCGCSC